MSNEIQTDKREDEKHDVFISYARHDKNENHIALKLKVLLSEAGLNVFIDTMIKPGKNWREIIKYKLEAATNILVIMTPSSIERPWVWVEVGAAKKSLKILLIGIKRNDTRLLFNDRLSPIEDIQFAEISLYGIKELIRECFAEPSKIPDGKNNVERISEFVALCKDYQSAPDPERPWCQEIGRKPVCEHIKKIGAAVGQVNDYLQSTGVFHDLAWSQGLLWFGRSNSWEVSDQIKKILLALKRAEKTWEFVLMGNSLNRFFIRILEGEDDNISKGFKKDFVNAVIAGMRVKVLLRMPKGRTTATDRAIKAQENRNHTVRGQTNETLKKIAQLRGEDIVNPDIIEVRLTQGEMHTSLIWLKHDGPDAENFMLATHYMQDGLHDSSHSAVLSSSSRLIVLYEQEFVWNWRQRIPRSRPVKPLSEPNARGDYFDYIDLP